MNIAVVLGDASASICSKVAKLRDDLNTVPFLSLGELFRESEYLQYSIDRVLLTAKVLRQGDVEDNISRLSDLLGAQKDFSSVVFLCKEETDSELEELLLTKFSESECAVLSVLSTSVTNMMEFMSLQINALQDEYGFESRFGTGQVSVLDDEISLPEDLMPETQPVVEQLKSKKGFFLNSLFGRDKETDSISEEEPAPAQVEESTEIQPEEDVSQDSSDLAVEPAEVVEETVDAPADSEEVIDSEVVESSELLEDLSETPSSPAQEEVKEQISEVSDDVRIPNNNTEFQRIDLHETLSDIKNADDLVEVDYLGDLLDLSSEEQFRKPKIQVVEKEVERIVERVVTVNAGGGKVSVFSKQASRMILVTGDRRSGVTWTALSLAYAFSSHKLSTLYVDCDRKRKGVLSYVDYTEFCKNDTLTKGAMHLATSWENILHGQFRAQSNLGIVTSNYDVTVTEEDLKRVLELVSMYGTDFDVVILDIPLESLSCAESAIPLSKCVITCEGTTNGLSSYALSMDCNPLVPKYQNLMAKKGTMLFTKCPNNFKATDVLKPVSSILSPEYDWFSMKCALSGEFDESLVSYLLEV